MIVVDTSALLSLLQDEAEANAIAKVLKADGQILMSAATLAESLNVARRRDSGKEMAELIRRL